ncbi:unnamed protein product [Vicia faba]|uniref:F-box domain-containing protein n=1 Tax=Vicia faba TaxID=3906 RepID=A0AAV0ZPG6_VICFA|nr:unnamed protein product [Vicia faba]
MDVSWTALPPEIIETISQKLPIYTDYIRFRSVCRTWFSSLPKTPLHLPPQLPWLIFSQQSFFDISTHKTHLINLPLSSHRTRICGSSHGFLIILNETPQIRLFNPLTGASLFLPPLHTFPNVVSFDYSNIGREYFVRNPNGDLGFFNLKQMCNYFIRKIVLSSSPQNDHFVAFAIVDGYNNLAFCKKGYDSWIFMSDEIFQFWEDVVYHQGLFYAVSKGGMIVVCDVDIPRVSVIETNVPVEFSGDIFYVVFSGEEMLLVTRSLGQEFSDGGIESNDMFVYKTVGFEVFKMDWNVMAWEKIETLGDRALFVGGNSSLCFSAVDFVGCCADCIYFTDDYSESNHDDAYGKHDFGVFRLLDQIIDPLLPSYPRNSYSWLGWPLPIWVSPNPC